MAVGVMVTLVTMAVGLMVMLVAAGTFLAWMCASKLQYQSA